VSVDTVYTGCVHGPAHKVRAALRSLASSDLRAKVEEERRFQHDAEWSAYWNRGGGRARNDILDAISKDHPEVLFEISVGADICPEEWRVTFLKAGEIVFQYDVGEETRQRLLMDGEDVYDARVADEEQPDE
jgi:hypothetical protein